MAAETGLSQSSVSRNWRAFGLKPHLVETWKLSADPWADMANPRHVQRPPRGPDLVARQRRTRSRCARRGRSGSPLASRRDHPARPRPGRGRRPRAESEYGRLGTLAYLAAYDVHRARVYGRCEETTGIKPFTALVDQVMQAEPYASAKRVFWVVDNGASHRNWAAADRLATAYPNAQMVHLPVHASRLNQVEVYFSVIQRKLLTPDDFDDLDHLAEQILAFEQHYNAQARPFGWRFTRTDLNQLLARIHKHDRFSPRPMAA
jgi:hypothetical protein